MEKLANSGDSKSSVCNGLPGSNPGTATNKFLFAVYKLPEHDKLVDARISGKISYDEFNQQLKELQECNDKSELAEWILRYEGT